MIISVDSLYDKPYNRLIPSKNTNYLIGIKIMNHKIDGRKNSQSFTNKNGDIIYISRFQKKWFTVSCNTINGYNKSLQNKEQAMFLVNQFMSLPANVIETNEFETLETIIKNEPEMLKQILYSLGLDSNKTKDDAISELENYDDRALSEFLKIVYYFKGKINKQ